MFRSLMEKIFKTKEVAVRQKKQPRDFVRNLGKEGQLVEAVEQIDLEGGYVEKKILRRNLLCGLGMGGHVAEALKQIDLMATDDKEQKKLRECFVEGLGIGKHINEAKEQIELAGEVLKSAVDLLVGPSREESPRMFRVDSQERSALRTCFVRGLGISGYIVEAMECIHSQDHVINNGLLGEFIYGLALGGHVAEAKKQIRPENIFIPKNQLRNLARIKLSLSVPYLYGLGIAGYFAEAKEYIRLEMQNSPQVRMGQKKYLQTQLIWALGKGGHIEEAKEYIHVADSAEQNELRSSFVDGLAKGGHIAEAVEYMHSVSGREQKNLCQSFLSGLVMEQYIPQKEKMNLSAPTKEEILRLVYSIPDKEIGEEIISYYTDLSSPDGKALLSEAKKLAWLGDKYHLRQHFNQAKALSEQEEGVKEWILCGPGQLVREREIFPEEIYMRILSFVLGLSDRDTRNVFKSVHDSIFFGRMEKLGKMRLFSPVQHAKKSEIENDHEKRIRFR